MIAATRLRACLVCALALLLAPASLSAQEAKSLRLVLQQNGQGLVTELRPLALPSGKGLVVLPDLPASIEPQTLQVRSKTAPKALQVLDLTLDDDLLTPANLLRRFEGRQVTLILPDGKTEGGRVKKEATVLAAEETPLYLVDGQVYAGPVEAVLYPELPEGMSPRPRLSMNVKNSGPAKQDVELAYMARELSWRMDYVLTLDKAGTSGLLSGWASLTNRSGKSFGPASIELLAGEPRRVSSGGAPRALFAAAPMAKAMADGVESAELFEYHVYTLKQPVSLANRQTRQAPLFEQASIPVSRRLVGRAGALPSGREAETVKQNLDVVISYRNTEALGLGSPLPNGALRVFQEENGARHFLGEANVPRAAVGAGVEATIGQAFDVSVERKVADYEKTGKSSYRAAWELSIKNGGRQARQLVLQEQIPGKWKVEGASHKWTKARAGVLEFVIDVPPTREGEPVLLKYSFSTEL